ncbi:T9SS type A sorting domain-containing protein [candidate division KSB1 bacterium]|nr:T9SS type A sorting domain-containing protein [candidate division KSB1 bacterium]
MKKATILFVILIAVTWQAFGVTKQGHYRWRNDDGSEADATWKADEDTPSSAEKNANVRLRVELYRYVDPGTQTLSLFYSTDPDLAPITGDWTKITTDGSANAFKLSSTDNYTEHENALDRLTDTYSHAWGFCNELNDQNDYIMLVDESMEAEFCLQPTDNAQLSTNYYFAIRYANEPYLRIDGYDFVPTLTVTDASLPVELASFTTRQTDRNIILEWTTETEMDNLGFILERRYSTNETWVKFAGYQTFDQLKGQGTTTTSTNYRFVDSPDMSGESVQYRLSSVDKNGAVKVQKTTSLNLNNVIPNKFSLEPAFPNPFNPGTTLRYDLAQESSVELCVYDLLGHTVNILVDNEKQSAGTYSVSWNGTNNNGQNMPSGTYIVHLKAGVYRSAQKVTLIR